MSVCRECHLVEAQPGKWYCLLERTSSPLNAWSWKEYADCFGPFPSEEEAYGELDCHSNPGGYSAVAYRPSLEEEYAGLLQNVKPPTKTRRFSV